MRVGRRWASVLFWSVISAAFIGPGTVATAASAGASFGVDLLWALAFSTLACLTLQEAAARLTIVSGRDLGQALRAGRRGGAAGLALVLAAIVVGCAAYQAGNLLGAAAGATLALGGSAATWSVWIGLVAAALLATGRTTLVARLLALMVGVMGAAFLVTAWRLAPAAGALLSGLAVPRLDEGSGLTVLGLVGTTVVPYNLFLGSGLARGRGLADTRFGLAVAIVLGGAISMAVVVAGTAVAGAFDFDALARVLQERLGAGGRATFAVGLLAAGASSAITAPLAAAVTARSLFAHDSADPRWSATGWRYRSVWGAVLLVGIGFGVSGVRPVPAIVLAQAANGVLLPVAAVVLALAVNDRRTMGECINGAAANAVLAAVVAATFVLGAAGVVRATAAALGWPPPGERPALLVACAALVAASPWLVLAARRRRAIPPIDPRQT